VAIVAAALGLGWARADPATETRLREALRSAQTQLRTLEDDKSRWQQAEAELQKELTAAKKELAAVPKAKAGADDRALAEFRRRVVEEQGASAKLKGALAACEAASQEAVASARTAEGERTKLKADVAALNARLAASAEKNARIYQLARQVLDWVSSIGAREETEPMFGLERVRLENLAQDYGDQLYEQRIPK
jgi:septal ring factor EnvC (AmiA/AmiB activator)